MKKTKSKAKTENRERLPAGVIAALVVLLFSLLIYGACSALAWRNQHSFTPPSIDPTAMKGLPEVPAGLGWGEIWQEGMEFKAGVCGVVVIEDSKADVYFSNLEGDAKLKLRVLDRAGNVLGETGIIEQGWYVPAVKFETVPENGADITFKIMAYDVDDWGSLGSVLLNTTATVKGAQ